MEDKKEFFKFYEDSFEKTKASYQKIIEAFVVAGILEKGTTLESVVEKCKEIDAEEVKATNGQVKESNIGLQGYFASLGYSEANLENDEEAKRLYAKCKISSEKMPNNAEDRLKALYMAMGQKALTYKALTSIEDKNGEEITDASAVEKDVKNIKESIIAAIAFIEDKNGEEITDASAGEKDVKNIKESIIDASAFLGSLAAGPYFPRQTCFSASQLMGKGNIMQIGCSQGKTSVVAMTTYEQLMKGKKVFSTSSAPGLVPENYDEARAFYQKMGIEEDFCAISQNEKDNIEHIVLFHNGEKYEIRADGQIYEEVIKEQNEKEQKTMEPMKKFDKNFLEELGIKLSEDPEKSYNFEESVKAMMVTKGIIMGDTITLGKYQHLMPKRNDEGVIANSFLIVDEADAELYDTKPQEITGKEYSKEEAENRWKNRLRVAEETKNFNGNPSELEKIAQEKNIDIGFLVDAYEAKTNFVDEKTWEVKDGKVFVLNPNTNVMIPASQGLQEAVLAMNSGTRDLKVNPEKEVIGETNIPKLFSNFETASLMSGTMEDKGMSELATEGQKKLYNEARKAFLLKCGPGIASCAIEGVIDWKLVTPKTRQEKGDAIVNLDGIEYDDKSGKISTTKGFSLGEENWEDFTEKNKEALEEKWKEEIRNEAKRRSENGQPVMISVYGDRVPLEEVELYTAKHQIGKEHEYNKDKYMSSTVGEDGKETGEIAQFDDFYGRGYTFKFLKKDENGEVLTEKRNEETKPIKQKKGGHVLISSLPQNSRNLEQFLFRVARGGDKGSSSILISPTDPKLVEYLKTLDPITANKYFEDVMNGTIEINQVVCDIYPQETIGIFANKVEEMETTQEYNSARARHIEVVSKIQSIGEKNNGDKLCETYEEEYKKQQQKMMKLHRVAGMPKDEDMPQYIKKIHFNTTRQLILDKKIEKPSEIIGMLPPNVTLEELQELIPEDKELTYKLISLNEKINEYVKSRQSDSKTTKNEKINKYVKSRQSDSKTTKDDTKRTTKEIEIAAKEDNGYNEEEMVKALTAIRNEKLGERDNQVVEAQEKQDKGDSNIYEHGI